MYSKDFEALDEDYEKKSHDFAQAFLKGKLNSHKFLAETDDKPEKTTKDRLENQHSSKAETDSTEPAAKEDPIEKL